MGDQLQKNSQSKQKKCYIYTRVSTEMQIEGYSLDAQKDRLYKEAKHREMKVVGEYSDEGKSGKNIQGRPEFKRMLDDIRSGKDAIDYVLVFKLSRFGRNAADTLNSLQFLEDFGVNLLCVEDGIDSAGAAGKLLIAVYAAVAEAERENIKAQTMAGRWQKAREGKWNGGFAPYGYEIENGILKINEDEAVAVRLIFDKYGNTSMGIDSVAKWLNENGYKKIVRQNGTLDKFSQHFIKIVLDNPVYAGYMPYGRRRTEKIEGTRNEYHIVPQEEYELFEGKHEAIIDRELWQKVRAKRDLNAFKREKRFSLDHAHVLSGIVKCPRCGASMYGVVNRKKKKGKDEYYTDMWYYLCKNNKESTGHICGYSKHVRQDIVDEQVIAIVKQALKDAEFTGDIFKKVGTDENLAEFEKNLKQLKKVKSSEEAKKSKLLSKILALDPSDDLYDSLYADLQGLLRELSNNIMEYEENIAKLELKIANARGKQLTAEKVYEVMAAVIQEIDSAPDEDKRLFMNYLLDSVQLYEQRQPNGLWVKSVRFKVPLEIDGQLLDTIEVSGPDDDDDDDGPDDGGSPVKPKKNGDRSGDKNSLPSATHDETCVLLGRESGRDVKYEYIDYVPKDNPLEKKRARYSDIQAWVEENYGFKVSSLYIGQVKDICGLAKERDLKNYGKNRVPQCPLEKVEAIKAAFKHFGMIE